jgi:DNA modification methylase
MLEVIEPNTIDSIVTDPPYGLTSITKRFGKENSAECQYGKDGSFARLSRGFMGKEWDGSGIEYNIDTWKKCYEVLKPGGYLLAFGGSRTFHRIACAIEDAGFEIRDTIMWIYGMGFPKSQNIGKQLEKRLEDEKTKQKTEHDLRLMWERDIQKTMRNEEEQNEVLQSQLQEQSLQISGNTTSNVWRKQSCLERWNNIQKTERELQRCKVCEMSKRVSINGEERWICNGTQTCNGTALREMFEQSGSCPSYRPQSKQQQDRESNAIQEQCRTQENREVIEYWNKFGTALKPSFEPIIVARKPFKGSLVDNVIEYGVGGINIDECRVEYEKTTNPATNPLYRQQNADKYKQVQGGELSNGAVSWTSGKNGVSEMGRFPANTILTYDENDFDEVCGGFPDTNGGKRHNTTKRIEEGTSYYRDKEFVFNRNEYNDSGSASRYFYCAKASKRDRDEGLDEFEEVDGGSYQFRQDGSLDGKIPARKNTHPTVKPTELMQYLVRLVTPNNGIVLDPFNGSGSTGKAVMYENKERNKNYKYIGIELTEEYLPIAKARIEYVCNLIEEEKTKDKQLNLFDLGESNE